jgi:site-specific DNA-methyltransferase (adenine-specific)
MQNLIQGDCLEKLKDIDDNSVDCFICDLPYGTTAYKKSWDNKIDLDELWRELKRIAKNDNTPYFFFCDFRFGTELYNSNIKWFRYDMVIKKSFVVGFLNSKRQPLREHELLLVFYKKSPTYNITDNHTVKSIHRKRQPYNKSVYGKVIRKEHKYYEPPLPRSILNTSNSNHHRNHPTEKSQDILEWIIKYYTNEGDTILDPTMGSGSTGKACVSLNRKFIGIEKDKEYFDIATKRINNNTIK